MLPDKLSEQLMDDLVALSRDRRFQHVWSRFEQLEEALVEEILNPDLDPQQRDKLVAVRSTLRRDVIDLPALAIKQADKKEQ